jgi:hypothetical protein
VDVGVLAEVQAEEVEAARTDDFQQGFEASADHRLAAPGGQRVGDQLQVGDELGRGGVGFGRGGPSAKATGPPASLSARPTGD